MTDHPKPFSPDDPRLTAYLLGEMEADEQTAFEAELQSHPEAMEHLEALRETSSLLSEALEKEPAPALSAAQRAEILSAAAISHSPPSKEKPVMKSSNHRGTWAIVVAIAALSVVVAVLLQSPEESNPVLMANKEPAEVEEAAKYQRLEAENAKNHAEFAQARAELAERLVRFSDEQKLGDRESATRSESLKQQVAQAPLKDAQKRLKETQLFENFGTELQAGEQGQATPGPPVQNPYPGGQHQNGQPGQPASPDAPAPDSSLRGAIPPGTAKPQTNAIPQLANAIEFSPDGRDLPLGWRKADLDWKERRWNLEFEGEAPGAGNESYEPIFENDFILPRGEQALSTFSIDVDTASYSNVRRFIKHGQRPPADAVRIEELVNYFHYDYAPPVNGDPFSVHTEVALCPWKPEHYLVRFGLKGREIAKEQRPLSNLVFLVDVSGSMSSENKLPLVKKALTMLANEMNENDRISIVTYAGNAGVKLPSTSGEHKSDIISAIQSLSAGGSTNGEAGLHLAYTQAIGNFIEDGSNRVILCTDGDFNVGVSGDEELVNIIQDKAKKSGVFLSVFGFGMGNYKDSKLEKLADKGNGHYAYIDNEREAKKVFVEELTGTLYTIAKDVKIQVKFNPVHVGSYRLIGYENRVLAAQDFNDDTKDAGEIGAGHTVTALYEIIPANKMPAVAQDVDRLKYQPAPDAKNGDKPSPELLTLKLRFKKPDEDVSVKREYPVKNPGKRAAEPSRETEWQAAVAAFGMVLRGSKHKGQSDLRLVRELAMGSRGPDPTGRRREFIDLILTAEKLAAGQPPAAANQPKQLPDEEAKEAASVKGKYKNLLKTVPAPQDLGTYGAFNDYGYWEGDSYGDHDDLPKAHWVYVYPNWYLWGEAADSKQE